MRCGSEQANDAYHLKYRAGCGLPLMLLPFFQRWWCSSLHRSVELYMNISIFPPAHFPFAFLSSVRKYAPSFISLPWQRIWTGFDMMKGNLSRRSRDGLWLAGRCRFSHNPTFPCFPIPLLGDESAKSPLPRARPTTFFCYKPFLSLSKDTLSTRPVKPRKYLSNIIRTSFQHTFQGSRVPFNTRVYDKNPQLGIIFCLLARSNFLVSWTKRETTAHYDAWTKFPTKDGDAQS